MKEVFDQVVATMKFKNGSIYIASCLYGEYEKLKEIIYTKASDSLKSYIAKGCEISANFICSATQVENYKKMLAQFFAQEGVNVLNGQRRFETNSGRKAPDKSKPVVVEDNIMRTKTTYTSIKEASEGLKRNYNTVYKYLKENALLDGRYLISYSEPVEGSISEGYVYRGNNYEKYL